MYLLRDSIRVFNSGALYSIFYTGFKTMCRDRFSFAAQAIILEWDIFIFSKYSLELAVCVVSQASEIHLLEASNQTKDTHTLHRLLTAAFVGRFFT